MNKQKPDSANGIHWTRIKLPDGTRTHGFTWNPVGGCNHQCQWTMPDGKVASCYAEDVANGVASDSYPHGFRHHYFHPGRLEEPISVKKPAGIFLDSMSDIMGAWVPDEQINQVLDVCRLASQHTFFLLTKNHGRLSKFKYSDNIFVGVSVPPDFMNGKKLTRDQQEKMLTAALINLAKVNVPVTWMSFEPLSWDVAPIVRKRHTALNWAVIGAASNGKTKYQPDEDHLKALVKVLDNQGVPIFFKGNLKSSAWALANWREDFPTTEETLYKHKDEIVRGLEVITITTPISTGYRCTVSTPDDETTRIITDDEIGTFFTGKQKQTPPAPVETPAEIEPNKIYNMPALDYFKTCKPESIHCIVTSPPYWGLRDYGTEPIPWPAVKYSPLPGMTEIEIPAMTASLGQEPTLESFIGHLVLIFREARRVLHPTGTVWVNMGDCYAGTHNGYSGDDRPSNRDGSLSSKNAQSTVKQKNTVGNGLKPKDLVMQPARLALALQADGYYLRSDIIWHKTNAMPESVNDRPTTNHEHVFLMSKSQQYFYDKHAITEPVKQSSIERLNRGVSDHHKNLDEAGVPPGSKTHSLHQARAKGEGYDMPATKNKRTVWTVATKGFPDAHFATFPEALIDPMILAGCPPKVCPSCLSPWKRETETEEMFGGKYPNGAGGQKQYHRNQEGGGQDGLAPDAAPWRVTKTTGWQPTCKCTPIPSIPGTVCDPFMGSGTTALVATKNGRNHTGCDNNADYVKMATERLAQPIEEDMFTSKGMV